MARVRRRTDVLVGVICAWAIIVALFFLWQTVNYRGLVALVAEWQFNLFGRYFPTLSYVLFVLLFASPILLLVRGRWWERDADPADPHSLPLVLRGVTRFMRAMFGIAIGFVAIAAIAVLLLLTLPSNSGPVQTVRVGGQGAPGPREGATLLVGSIVYSRTSAFDQDLWLVDRDLRFAPMFGSGDDRQLIRYFVELGPEEPMRPDTLVEQRRGILKHEALPGELVRLYRYAGYDIADPYHVLYRSERSLRWPHLEVAVQMLIAALFFALLGVWQLFVRRRLLAAPPPAEAPQP